MRWLFLCGLFLLGLTAGCDAQNANQQDIRDAMGTGESVTTDPNTRTAPDNTAVNERDRDGNTVTPFDQGESAEDRETTANIRQQVVDLPDVSVNARNVKIITRDGQVTLRGPVETQDEREAIEKIAKGVAGSDNVDSQLEVAPD